MTDQHTYDRTLDTPASGSPAPVAPLPNEPYYQQPPAPPRGARNPSLGIALVLVGLVLLAFQIFGRGVSFGGNSTIMLVDRQLPGNRIELVAGSSDVEVGPWDGTEIRVEATQRGGARGDYTVNVSQSGQTVQVVEASNNLFCFFCSRSMSYRISVPASAQAAITTSSGEIVIEGVDGAVTLSTVSGDIRANDLQGGLTAGTTSGEVRLNNLLGKLEVNSISGDVQLEEGKVEGASINTTSGEVTLDGVSGALNIETVSGDVTVRDAQASQLSLSTTSGDIEYTGELAGSGASTLNSISGDLKLALPEDSSVKLDASTVSGDISSDFDLRDREQGRRSLKGVVGGGAAAVTLATTSGDISIEKR